MSYSKIRIYYRGDGINSAQSGINTRQEVEKKVTLALPKRVKEYGDSNGYGSIFVDHRYDHVILRGGGEVLMDVDINAGSNEYIRIITKHEWLL